MRRALNTAAPAKAKAKRGEYPAPEWPVLAGDYRAEYVRGPSGVLAFGATHGYRITGPDVLQDFDGFASEAAACAYARERVECMAADAAKSARLASTAAPAAPAAPEPLPQLTLF